MKRITTICVIICFMTLTVPFVSLNSFSRVQAQTMGNFRLDQIIWTGARNPGASGIQLQFQIMNLKNSSISSIFGTLSLPYPFEDSVDGDTNATAIGETLSIYFNVSQYIVLTGEPFELVYSIDIDAAAIKGKFPANLTINYFFGDNGSLTEGAPVIFDIMLEIPNSSPEIEWVRPAAVNIVVEAEKEINFTVLCSDIDNDPLIYSWEVDNNPTGISDPTFLFTSPKTVGVKEISLYVSDGNTTITRNWFIETEILSETSIEVNSQYLEAGTSSELVAQISNNIWKGKVDVELQIPSPLVIQGNSSWEFYNVTEGDSIQVPASVFAPLNAMGGTGTGVLTIQFSDKHGTNYLEALTVGMIIHGKIQVNVFSSEISETSIKQGGIVEISITLLNTGNANALFANASLESEDDIILPSSSSISYLGELEPDSPLPFSVSAILNNSTPLGTHNISCVIFYQDDLYFIHGIRLNFSITVENAPQTTGGVEGDIDLGILLLGSGFTLFLGGGTIFAVVYVIFRKK
ncbi:MAG: hypothetical protein ACXACK_14285 [Candidatus Hodarchaeales archaeon]|jgi:hypothetical protein